MVDRRRIDDVALRVVDGDAIDWRKELDSSGEEAPSKVMRNLRLVDSIARTLREQPVEPADRDTIQDLLESLRDLPLAETTPAMPESWGKLQIRGHIGAGAFADVYRAFDPALEREVALKLFRSTDPGLQQRMLDEGQRMARVNHPGVVRIYGAEEHDDRVGLWMELVAGRTLEASLDEHGKYGAGELAAIGRTLSSALAAIHQAGLIHGDIKAQNVLRDDLGRLLLTDFGSGTERGTRTGTGRIRGTPLYLAPEILSGGDASVQSDIYSVGVLLFLLASGEFPVAADSLPQLQEAHRGNRRRSLVDLRPDLPGTLAAAIDKATDPAPERRYRSMGEFARALDESTALETPQSAGTRRPLHAIGILAAVIAAAWLLSGPFMEMLRPQASAYQLDLALHRFGASGAERLEPGASIAVGDTLALEFSASADLYVFVFNEDRRGHAWGLFPLEPGGASRPLPGGETHWLPGGAGADTLRWQVDSVGGMERIHVIASPEPLVDIERLYMQLPPARMADSGGVFRARGIGTLSASTASEPVSVAPLAHAAANLAGASQVIEGVHYEVIELRNPGG